MNYKGVKYGIILIATILLLIIANLLFGSVHIPASAVWNIITNNATEKASWSFIIMESRVPQAITALLCGAALAGSGLMLQTAFNNPLAGPSILGITSGANLGVALVMLAGGGTLAAGIFNLSNFFSVILGAFVGSMLVMFGINLGNSQSAETVIAIIAIIFAFGFPLIIVFTVFFFNYKNRKAKYRLAEQALSTGQQLPEDFFKKAERSEDTRSKGIKNIFLGIGLFIFLWAMLKKAKKLRVNGKVVSLLLI